MGYYTWFMRPITDEEFSWLKEYAVEDAIKKLGDTKFNRKYCKDLINLDLIEAIKRSVETGEKCCYGYAWYEYGYGNKNPKFYERDGDSFYTHVINGVIYTDTNFKESYAQKKYGMSYKNFLNSEIYKQIDFSYFGNEFRVDTYSRKIIHSRHELRKCLKKKYFELSEWQKKRISKFFELYPGGIIIFG